MVLQCKQRYKHKQVIEHDTERELLGLLGLFKVVKAYPLFGARPFFPFYPVKGEDIKKRLKLPNGLPVATQNPMAIIKGVGVPTRLLNHSPLSITALFHSHLSYRESLCVVSALAHTCITQVVAIHW